MSLNRCGTRPTVTPNRIWLAGMLILGLGAGILWLGSVAAPNYAAGDMATANLQLSAPFRPQSPTAAGNSGQGNGLAAYRDLPLCFEPNLGQSDPQVQFLARGSGYGLFLTAEGPVLAIQHAAASTQQSAVRRSGHVPLEISVVPMKLVGANVHAQAHAMQPLPGKSNYLLGNDSAKWLRGVPQFARVLYSEVYPGIDLVYYGNQGKLEHDFVVAPGADPGLIQISFQGAGKVSFGSDGSLRLFTPTRELRLEKPRVYQSANGERREVRGNYVLLSENRLGFQLGAYDSSQTLVIDPVLSYSTYLGGSGSEVAPKIAVDSAFNFYVSGSTASADFPIPSGTTPFQGTLKGFANVFVAKFNPAGSAPLVFATYLGGSGTDTAAGIALDSGFNVYVAGTTSSGDFPTTASAFRTAPVPAGNHVFVSKLDPAGASLLYSTYLSGSSTDTAAGVAADATGDAFVAGTTQSADFPTTAGVLQPTSKATNQFFVSKVNTALSGTASLAYSTYLGGAAPAGGVAQGGGIAVDLSGNAYITGGTTFTDLPVTNAFQATLKAGVDAFVAKLNAGGTAVSYLSFLGGSGDDTGNALAVDSAGNAYVTGSTTSNDFTIPTGTTPFQTNNAGGTDAFVAKVNNPASGSIALVYFTYLGGSGTDVGLGVAADANQNAYVTGSTNSSDFNKKNPVQAALGGGTDAFVAKFDTSGNGQYSTYLGGSGNDRGTGVAVDILGNTLVAGDTASVDFPTVSPFQASPSGPSDAFVSRIGAVADLSFSAATATPAAVGLGNQVTFKYTIKNNGPDATTGVTVTDILPASGATFVSANASPGTCAAPTGTPSTLTCQVGTLANAGTATVNVILTPSTPGTLGNSASVSVSNNNSLDPTPGNNTASTSATVADYLLSVDNPTSVSVPAGQPATYTARITPVPTFPNSISLSCSGLPTATTCAFSTNPVPAITNSSPVTSALTLNTTARPATTAALNPMRGLWYAAWLPLLGVALAGVGSSGRKRALMGLLLVIVLSLGVLQIACGSNKKPTPPAGGTPAGTYTVNVAATSGSVSRTAQVTLVVQ